MVNNKPIQVTAPGSQTSSDATVTVRIIINVNLRGHGEVVRTEVLSKLLK